MKDERAQEIYKKLEPYIHDDSEKGQEEFWRILLEETTEDERQDIQIMLDNDSTEFLFVSETPDADDDSCYCLLGKKKNIPFYEFHLCPGIYWQNVQYLLRALGFSADPV